MTGGGPTLRAVEIDAFGLAVGTALVAGGLSLAAPFLTALVGALAALAVASWAMAFGSVRPTARSLRARGPGLGSLALGGSIFIGAPAALLPYRGLVLAVTLVPLWALERSARRRAAGAPGAE